MLLLGVPILLLTMWGATLAFGPVSRRYVERFLDRYPVRMTVNNGPMVVRRLARVRAARTIGVLAGLLVGVAAGLMGAHANVLLAMVVGYLLGAIVAELPARRDRVAARVPAATLVPRRLADYVPRWIVVAPAVILAVTLAIDVAGALGAQRPNLGYDPTWRATAGIVAMLLASLLTLFTARMILYRRQPYTTGEMVSADDALRAASMHCVCGGGFALVAALAAASLVSVSTFSDVQLLRWVAPGLGIFLWLVSVFAWFGLRNAPWLVRRPYETMVA